MEIGRLRSEFGGLKIHRSPNGATFSSMGPLDTIEVRGRRDTKEITWIQGTIKTPGVKDRVGWVAERRLDGSKRWLDITVIPDTGPPPDWTDPGPLPEMPPAAPSHLLLIMLGVAAAIIIAGALAWAMFAF